MKTKEAIILLGMPGCGKGTALEFLQEQFEQEHQKCVFTTDTGKLFRATLKNEPEAIIKLNTFNKVQLGGIQDAGLLQPSALATAMWAAHFLAQYNNEPGIIMDGSPRRKEEALVLEQFLSEFYGFQTRYLYIETEIREVVKRMKERHLTHPRPETATDAAINRRILDFHQKTLPTILFLKEEKKAMFHIIPNNGTLSDLKNALATPWI